MSHNLSGTTPLFALKGADFQSTSDQTLKKLGLFTSYRVTGIVARRASGAVSVACLGGLYNAAAKGGDAIVAAGQSWAGLSGAGKIVDATLAGLLATDAQTATPILSLSTGSTGAVTGDVFVFGQILD